MHEVQIFYTLSEGGEGVHLGSMCPGNNFINAMDRESAIEKALELAPNAVRDTWTRAVVTPYFYEPRKGRRIEEEPSTMYRDFGWVAA